MNRSEQEHLYRQSRQVSVVRSTPALRHSDPAEDGQDASDNLLLNVLHSPVTRDREQRRKSSSVLLKPPSHLAERRASSIFDAQLPFIDAQNAVAVDGDVDDDDDFPDEPDAATLEVSPRYVSVWFRDLYYLCCLD